MGCQGEDRQTPGPPSRRDRHCSAGLGAARRVPNCLRQPGAASSKPKNDVAPQRLSKERWGVCLRGRGLGGSALYKGKAPGFLFSEARLKQTSGPLGRTPAGTLVVLRATAHASATRWDVGDPDDGHLMERKAPPRKTKQGAGQHRMRGTAGQIKPSGLGLNLKSVQLGERTGQQEPTARGRRWRSGPGDTGRLDTGVCLLPGTPCPASWDSEGRAGGKVRPLGDWRRSAGKRKVSRTCTVTVTGQGHLPPWTRGQTCSEQWVQTPDLRPQGSGER